MLALAQHRRPNLIRQSSSGMTHFMLLTLLVCNGCSYLIIAYFFYLIARRNIIASILIDRNKMLKRIIIIYKYGMDITSSFFSPVPFLLKGRILSFAL